MRAPINGDVLRWARVIGGVSRDELARAVGKDGRPDIIAAWEDGAEMPTSRQLEALANKLKRSISVFFLPAPPTEPDPTAVFQRTVSLQAEGFSAELRLAIRTARYVRDRFLEVMVATNELRAFPFPSATLTDDTNQLADVVRRILGVGIAEQCSWQADRAYDNWQEVLLRSGVLPQQFSVPKSEGWGFAISDGDLPVVAVNRQVHHKTAKTFTLWHEFGHILLRESSVSVIEFGQPRALDGDDAARTEAWCNRFAASFLLPLSEPVVRQALENAAKKDDLTADTIQRAASRFKISKYVFLGRMRELSLVTEKAYQEARSEWWAMDTARDNERIRKQKEKGGGPVPPWQTALADRSRPMAARVFFALRRGLIDEGDASDMLGITPHALERAEDELSKREAHA